MYFWFGPSYLGLAMFVGFGSCIFGLGDVFWIWAVYFGFGLCILGFGLVFCRMF